MPKHSRQTKQKNVLSELVTDRKEFFTAEDLLKNVHTKDPNIGIATIYRFLKNEVKNHRLYSYICDRKTIYSSLNKNHCHFECERTGKITHFTIDNLEFLKNKIPGKISSISILVKGVCNECLTDKHTEGKRV